MQYKLRVMSCGSKIKPKLKKYKGLTRVVAIGKVNPLIEKIMKLCVGGGIVSGNYSGV